MQGLYKAMDLCLYILKIYKYKGVEIEGYDIQNILFLLQAEYMSLNKGMAFIMDDFEAIFSPTIVRVKTEFGLHGSVKYTDSYIDYYNGVWNARYVHIDDVVIEQSHKDFINEIIVFYEMSGLSPIKWANKLRETMPYRKTYNEYKAKYRNEYDVIPKELIIEWVISYMRN